MIISRIPTCDKLGIKWLNLGDKIKAPVGWFKSKEKVSIYKLPAYYKERADFIRDVERVRPFMAERAEELIQNFHTSSSARNGSCPCSNTGAWRYEEPLFTIVLFPFFAGWAVK